MSESFDAIKLRQSFDMFNQPRQVNDIDLVQMVRDQFIAFNRQDKLPVFDSHPIILDAVDKTPAIQRWLLNRYWFVQLANAPVPTLNVRLRLIPDGTEEEWFKQFTEHVFPFVVEHDLPTRS